MRLKWNGKLIPKKSETAFFVKNEVNISLSLTMDEGIVHSSMSLTIKK